MHIGTLIGARMYPPCFEFFFKKKEFHFINAKKQGNNEMKENTYSSFLLGLLAARCRLLGLVDEYKLAAFVSTIAQALYQGGLSAVVGYG